MDITKEKEFTDDVTTEVKEPDETTTTTESTTTEGQGLPADWEPMVEKMANERAKTYVENHLVNLGKANPEFAALIKQRTGVDVTEGETPKKKEEVKEEDKSYFDEMADMKKELHEMKEATKRKDNQDHFNAMSRVVEKEMLSHKFFDRMTPQFRKDVHGMIFQNIMINGGDAKVYVEKMKESLSGNDKRNLTDYLEEKKDIQNTPIDMEETFTTLKEKFKDEKVKPVSAEGMKSGLFGRMVDEYWDLNEKKDSS